MNPPSPVPRLDAPPRRLHVLEVVGGGAQGGVERSVERLLEHLGRGDQFRFTVVCPFEGDFSERARAAGADVVIVPMAEEPSWQSLRMLTELVRHRQVDLLHAHLPRAHQLAGLVGRLTNVPVMASIAGSQIQLMDVETHRLVGSHLSVGSAQGHFHALGLGIDPEKVSCEPQGVDTQRFHPAPRPPQGLRERFGLAPGALLVGWVGRVSPEKAPEVFLRAVALLQERLPEAQFVVVGDGPAQRPLIEDVQRLGLEAKVHFTGPAEDLIPVYHDLDVQVFSANDQTLAMALKEGLASGVPAVAISVGGVPEIVEQGRSGWLVAPGDHASMADHLHQLLTAPDMRQRMGARARASMEERYQLAPSLAAQAQRMRWLVHRPIAEARRSAPVSPRAPTSRGQAAAQALHQPVQAAGTPASVLADPSMATTIVTGPAKGGALPGALP